MKRVGILGAGRIGTALYHMLSEVDDLTVLIGDADPATSVRVADVDCPPSLVGFLSDCDAVVNALPFHKNRTVADACRALSIHYFDFSEDIGSTAHIERIAAGAQQSFVPQCGLAPGAINILTASLIESFNGPVRHAEMRVGALPVSATNAMKYYLSWSAAGLVNEYIQPCNALYRGQPVVTMPLDGLERVVIDGVDYEAFNTSGGTATMCDTYRGRVENLTYKTLRYPGHCDHMRFVLKDLNLEADPGLLERIMTQDVALAEEDVVILYASVIGQASGGLRQRTKIIRVRPTKVGALRLSAIQTSTAAGMAAVIELWSKGKLPNGFVRQEAIRAEDFLATLWGGRVYGA